MSLWTLLKLGIKLNKYEGGFHWISWQRFLNQRLGLRDSKPSSWYIFSIEVPLIAPVIAKHVLYWIYSSLFLVYFFCWSTSYCASYFQACIILNIFKFILKSGIISLVINNIGIIWPTSYKSFICGEKRLPLQNLLKFT